MKYLSALLMLIIFTAAARAQDKQEAWVMVKNSAGNLLQVDVTTLKAREKADIYVWGLQSFKEPIIIEGISGRIFKVKTYYLINTELSKYSILRIAYYGSENRMLREFSYLDEVQEESVRYNYPILPGSDVEAICSKTVKYLRK
ncbi:MAG: hypothetical protein ACM3UR_09735 [Bacteroidota bacterium]|jgi:hypothetical protein|nr:hypothetical protein [Ignavibacteria bacterium]HEX2960974.1 hypothetical protein [Ignavibacteriales bacterium]MCU7499060.1 hypothetical protein [Ignavibacteria bacterium]MCU7512367.1 hypothetical protein [Ignavibacteria bacterium]MCU7521719.1 hypothetical protein [Ignavibacteria bacterium]